MPFLIFSFSSYGPNYLPLKRDVCALCDLVVPPWPWWSERAAAPLAARCPGVSGRIPCGASRPLGSGTTFPGRGRRRSPEGGSWLCTGSFCLSIKHLPGRLPSYITSLLHFNSGSFSPTQWQSSIPKWCVSSRSFMFSEKTAGDTFLLESSRCLMSLRLHTSLSRAEPGEDKEPWTRMETIQEEEEEEKTVLYRHDFYFFFEKEEEEV